MYDDHVVVLVNRHSVRTGRAAGKLEEEARPRCARLILADRAAHHLVRTRDRNMENCFGLIEDKAVRPCHSAENEVHLASMAQAKDRSGWVVVPTFALISDIEIAVQAEVQIVKPLEASVVASIPDQSSPPGLWIKGQDAVSVVGNKNAAIPVNLEAVGDPVVFGKHRPSAIRRDPEHAAMREVDAIQVACAIE